MKEEKPTKYKTNKYQPELSLAGIPNLIMETKKELVYFERKYKKTANSFFYKYSKKAARNIATKKKNPGK